RESFFFFSPRLRVSASPRLRIFLLWLVVALVLLYGIIYPNFFVFRAALAPGGEFSPANFFEVMASRAVWEAAATSVGVSLLTVCLCAMVGVPLAFLFERYEFPSRRFFA